MKSLWVILLALNAQIAFADIVDQECFKNEIDPSTRRIYQNQAQLESDYKVLRQKFPSLPLHPLDLILGYRVGKRESEKVKRLRPDKCQHCYVGCRISNEAGYEVAVYAAYTKEEMDITDCDRKTHYDLMDIDATVLGAEFAKQNPGAADEEYCMNKCVEQFPRRKRRK